MVLKKWFIFAIGGVLLMSLNAVAELKAGTGLRVVTPEPLLPISGGFGSCPDATEKRGDLFARALAFEKDDTKLVFVGVDFIGWTSYLNEKVFEQVKGVDPNHIMIGASHTHSGPDIYGFPDETGKLYIDMDYINWMVGEVAAAINEAVANLEPATVKIGVGEAQGQIAYNYYAPQLYDPRCSVLQALDSAGKPLCTMVNYAVHPEVLGKKHGWLSPDLCGPLYERIEANGGGMALFINGAQGGMVTADNRILEGQKGRERSSWEECQRIGHLLADEALRIINDAPVQEDPNLEIHTKMVTFPVEMEKFLMAVAYSPLKYPISEDKMIETRLNLVNFGSAQMITIPGEALPNIGFWLKRKMGIEHSFLLGLTNDALGYILTEVDYNSFSRYDYVSETSLGEKTGPIFMDNALEMVEAAPHPLRK